MISDSEPLLNYHSLLVHFEHVLLPWGLRMISDSEPVLNYAFKHSCLQSQCVLMRLGLGMVKEKTKKENFYAYLDFVLADILPQKENFYAYLDFVLADILPKKENFYAYLDFVLVDILPQKREFLRLPWLCSCRHTPQKREFLRLPWLCSCRHTPRPASCAPWRRCRCWRTGGRQRAGRSVASWSLCAVSMIENGSECYNLQTTERTDWIGYWET